MASSSVVNASINVSLSATPNNYGVTHIAVGALPDNVAWKDAVIVRKYAGYPQNINDGDQVYSIKNTNAVAQVIATGSGGAVTGVSLIDSISYYSDLFPLPNEYDLKAVSTVSVGNSIGSGAKVTILASAPSGLSVSSGNGGLNYAVNDILTIQTNALQGFTETSEPNEYGLSGYYHLYDTLGITTATTANPKTIAASTSAQENAPVKAYYSLFISYIEDYTGINNPTSLKWKLAGTASSILVKDTGTVNTLASHLPAFYLRDAQSGNSNDLLDFLKVFAFQLDVYKASSNNVFYSTNIATADEDLLKLLLKQFGVPVTNITDIAQARTLAANIVKIYKESGSLVGLQTLIEAYTGYGSEFIYGTNKMPDYNSSSFEENIGFWSLKPFSAADLPVSFTSAGPYEVVSTTTTVAAFTNGAKGYGDLGYVVSSASCATNSTTVTGTFTSDLKVGAALSVVGSTPTGVLRPGTVVTNILSTNTFRINFPPSVALSNDQLNTSTNMVTGMGKLIMATAASNTLTLVLGPKKAFPTSSVTNTTMVGIVPAAAAVNDYVIATGVPYGTYVTAITTPSPGFQTVVLSTAVSSLSTSTSITFSPTAAEKIGSQSAWIPVEEGKPYSFSYYFNSGEAITGTSMGTVSASISFKDRNGVPIGTYGTGSIYSSPVGATWSNTGVWKDVVAQWQAPAGAVYAEPQIQITPVTNTAAWYIDAAQFNHPVRVVQKEIVSSTVAKLTTEDQHNFFATRYGGSDPNYVYVSGLGAPYDGQHPIVAIETPTSVKFSISSTSTAPATATSGWIVSNPPFEDARKVTVDVLPNRINLITNPSFEVNTNFWGTSTNASSGSGVNCLIVSSNEASNFGLKSLKLTSSSAAKMSVFGYAGEFNSGTITSYTTPFKVDRSSQSEEIFYTFSFYSKAAVTSENTYAEIYWYKDDAATIPSDIKAKEEGSKKLNSTTSWTRNSVTGRVPEDARTAKVEIHIETTTASETHYIDNALFEKGFTEDTYFDGDFDGQNYSDNKDSVWETAGVPHACKSYFYLNRVANTGKLKAVITDGLYYV